MMAASSSTNSSLLPLLLPSRAFLRALLPFRFSFAALFFSAFPMIL